MAPRSGEATSTEARSAPADANALGSMRDALLLRSVLETVPDPVLVTGFDYRVQALNGAARRLLELEEAGEAPRCHALFHREPAPCACPRHACPLREAVESGKGLTVEHVHLDTKGELRTIEIAAAPLEIAGRLVGVAQTLRDVTETRRRERQLLAREAHARALASRDPLTGLLNRAGFFVRLDHALAMAERCGKQVAVGFLDLDDFKGVNDRFGHDAGDAVLQTCAARMLSRLRKSDAVGRLGGDEFAFLLEGLPGASAALPVARGILEELARPCQALGRPFDLRASLGLAVHPDHGTQRSALLASADRAMYRAKRAGGGRLELASLAA